MSETLGQRLRRLRHERGQRLIDIAPVAQISVSYLNDLEHDRTHPSLTVLVRIATALDLTTVALLTGLQPYDQEGNA